MKKLVYTLLLALSGTLAQAQIKIGANPGTIGSTSNLEVEANNGNKTIVNKTTGQVTITDGTQGVGKIFTSDTNGNGSWQSSAATQVNFFVTLTGVVPFTADDINTKINFSSAQTNVGNGFDLSTDKFTAPVPGIYYFVGTVYIDASSGNGSSSSPVPITFRDVLSIKINSVAKLTQENFQYQLAAGGTPGNAFSIAYLTRLNTGDIVELFSNSNKKNPEFVGYANSINAPQTSFQGFLIGQ